MLDYPCVPQDDYNPAEDAITLAVFVIMAVFCYFEYTSYNESPINQEITQCYTTTWQTKQKPPQAMTITDRHQQLHLPAAKC